MTLVEFLLARIAEEEVEARRAFDDLDLDGTGTGWSTDLGYEHNQLSGPGYVFTRHWSPERVLGECEAKRKIVNAIGYHLEMSGDVTPASDDLALSILHSLATVYADHPDYYNDDAP